MRLVTWATAALDVGLAAWAMACLIGITGIGIGIARHATLLAIPLRSRD